MKKIPKVSEKSGHNWPTRIMLPSGMEPSTLRQRECVVRRRTVKETYLSNNGCSWSTTLCIVIYRKQVFWEGSKAGTGPKDYYWCRQIIATNHGKLRLTRHRSALPANPTSSCPRSWSLGNATLVVAERSGWRRVLGASKLRPSAKEAHRYRKRTCLEALRLAASKLTQRGTGYPSWGDTLHNAESPEEAQDWTTTDRKEGEQLEDRRSVRASSCNCGDGTDQRVQSLMFMMMTMNFSEKRDSCSYQNTRRHAPKRRTKLHRVKSKNTALLNPSEQQTICPYLINLTYFCHYTFKASV